MEFSEAAILTVIKGTMLVTMDEVLAVYAAMAGGPVWSHQIPSVHRAMLPNMEREFPDLAQIDISSVTPETFHEWKAAHPELYTNRREVKPLGDFARDPLDGAPEDSILIRVPD